jgi:hypothetical protein
MNPLDFFKKKKKSPTEDDELLDPKDKRNEGGIWLGRITASRNYEQVYRRQAYMAYKFYNKNYDDVLSYNEIGSKFSEIETRLAKYTSKNNRANIFYANIETLLALVLPQPPTAKIYLNNKRDYTPTRANQTYDLAIGVLEDVVNYFIKKTMSKDIFKQFKLDHFITGRGVLWVDQYDKVSKDEQSQPQTELSIDLVKWTDYAQDPKLSWDEVRWVARRRFLSKTKLKAIYPETNFEDFSFTSNPYANLAGDDTYPEIDMAYLSTGGKYAEIWEVWDKFTKKKIVLSEQAIDKIITLEDIVNVDEDFFFPTPQPPLSIQNGIDLRPTSELWSYYHEMKQLSFISLRKEQLLKSLVLKGFVPAVNSDITQKLNNAKDGDIIAVQNLNPENPQVITYIDNKPKVEMLEILSKEHEALKNAIYEISGISDQMRNISAQGDSQSDEQTATEIKAKTLFGSRRLREKQDVIAQYLAKVYEIMIYRVCNSIEIETLKNITALNIKDSNEQELQALMQQEQQLKQQVQMLQAQAQSQPQPPQEQEEGSEGQPQMSPIEMQAAQAMQTLDQTTSQLQELRDEPTWQRITTFLQQQALQQIAIDVDLDDINNLMGKNQLSQETFTAASQLMQTMGNVSQMAILNPEYADVYCNLLEGNVDTSLYNLAQKRQIRDFTAALKQKVKDLKEHPTPPPPNPDLIKAQAQMQEAQARMMEAQAKIAVAQADGKLKEAEAQKLLGDMQKTMQGASQEMQMVQIKHQHDMEKLQAQMQAEDLRSKDKLQTDTNLMQMKIQADDRRYQEKMQSDAAKEQMKNIIPQGKI